MYRWKQAGLVPGCISVSFPRLHSLLSIHSTLLPRNVCLPFCSILRMPVEKHQRTLSFQVRHKLRNTHLRRYCHIHMDMVFAYPPVNQGHLFHLAQLLDDFHQIFLRFPIHYFPSVFWDKYYMIGAIPSCVCYTLIIHFGYLLCF